MTNNWINWQRLLEERRSNQAKEGEQRRSNLAQEDIKLGELNESQRHNAQSEYLSLFGLQEGRRHNVAAENETERHNLQQEQLTGYQSMRNYEIAAGNLALGELQSYRNYDVAQRNVTLGYSNLAENTRHNQTSEYNQAVSNWRNMGGEPVYNIYKGIVEKSANTEVGTNAANTRMAPTYRDVISLNTQHLANNSSQMFN